MLISTFGNTLPKKVPSIVETYYRKKFDGWVKQINARTKNLADAEDIVQEAFAKTIKRGIDFETTKDLHNWFSVTIYRVWSEYSRNKSGLNYDTEDMIPEDQFMEDRERIIDISIDLERFLGQYKYFKGIKKEIFTLHILHQFTAEDTAYLTGTTESSVRATVHRMRKDLDEYLQGS